MVGRPDHTNIAPPLSEASLSMKTESETDNLPFTKLCNAEIKIW
jgi:hypothetical protein